MKVLLKRTWFVEGRRYRKGVNEVPDHLKDSLPTGAEIDGKPKAGKGEAEAEAEIAKEVGDILTKNAPGAKVDEKAKAAAVASSGTGASKKA